jgi:acetyl-CoA carboxylase, biotin carboxylase subunit
MLIDKILIANRGEIALRALRACKQLNIPTVAVHSTADKQAMHVRLADESICIGGHAPKNSYLNMLAILSACEISNASAIYPGYGFLAENADFAEKIESNGFIFIGPTPDTLRLMGNKVTACQWMMAQGVSCIPGIYILPHEPERLLTMVETIGYPVIVKAAAGGGGRGMRVVHYEEHLLSAVAMAKKEAEGAFGSSEVYIEKFLERPRHIEFQIIGDGRGQVWVLGERDCSIQRRHQKMIEEAPAPGITHEQRIYMAALCRHIGEQMCYRGAGTLEFLYQDNAFYFIEMNPRVQVEHPVTEWVTGTDIVQTQIKIASDMHQLDDCIFENIHGHAIECRIVAEDEHFRPSPGIITHYHPPGGKGVRVDSHVYTGYEVSPYYDSLVAKITTYGHTRDMAIHYMRCALDEMIVSGIATNLPLQRTILHSKAFSDGHLSIHFLNDMGIV